MAKDSFSNVFTVDFQGSPRRMSDEAAEWLKTERKISRATLGKLPVASGMVDFPGKRKQPAILFQYETGWKARSFPEKSFISKVGTKRDFWNLRQVLGNPNLDRVYFVEGELDACALVESGIPEDCVLAAPSATIGEMEYVIDALAAGLNKATEFVWCGDQDAAGLELRSFMARLLGMEKVLFIEWPDGIKDANDFLLKDGPIELKDRVENGTKPWPVEGLFKLSELPDEPPLTTWETGFPEWGVGGASKLNLAAGTLSVVTGHPGMGKTQVWAQIWYQIVRRYDLVACVASFETRPRPHMRRHLRTFYVRGLERNASEMDLFMADKWIDEHYRFLSHKDQRPTLEWLLEVARVACRRDGAKILQIDPWNRLEAMRDGKETETDYIGRCLRTLYNFARDYNCHVQILAHPAKSDGYRRGMMPDLEDISGSMNWYNMCDQGFVVHRPSLFNEAGERVTYCELHHKKARFDELGYPTKFGLDYDVDQGRYGTCPLLQKKKKSPKQEAQQAKPEEFE